MRVPEDQPGSEGIMVLDSSSMLKSFTPLSLAVVMGRQAERLQIVLPLGNGYANALPVIETSMSQQSI